MKEWTNRSQREKGESKRVTDNYNSLILDKGEKPIQWGERMAFATNDDGITTHLHTIKRPKKQKSHKNVDTQVSPFPKNSINLAKIDSRVKCKM